MFAPEGYDYVELMLMGSNVRGVQVLVCDECGSIVGNTFKHNDWHKTVLIKQPESLPGIIRWADNPEKREDNVVLDTNPINTSGVDVETKPEATRFKPPFYADDVELLDLLHDRCGLGKEWRESESREEILRRINRKVIENEISDENPIDVSRAIAQAKSTDSC